MDLTGMRFGRVTVKEFGWVDGHRNAWWRCTCDCGTEFSTCGAYLIHGGTRSCGCIRREVARTNSSIAAVPVRLTYRDGTRREFESCSEASRHLGCHPASVFYWCGRGRPFRGAIIERIDNQSNAQI